MGTAVIQGELWGAHAQDWAFGAEPTGKPLWRAILEGCGVRQGTKLLDMGCGAGGLAVLASEMGANVTGLDASDNLLAIARERVPTADFRQGDLESLPFDDTTFDVVTAVNSIQFAGDQLKAASEARRVLKPDGRFGIGMWCEPERCEMRDVFGAIRGFMPPPGGDEPPPLNVEENLRSLVARAGFEIVSHGEVESVFEYPDVDDAWRTIRAAGLVVAARRHSGEEAVESAVLHALNGIKRPDGGVRMSNWFRFLICA